MTYKEDDLNQLFEEKEALRSSGRLHWFHWVVLACSMVLTLGAWYIAKQQVEIQKEASFNRQANQVVKLVSERMAKYEDALWSGVAAINALGGTVNNKQWVAYSERLELREKYPGINGIGVIHYLPNREFYEKYLVQKKAEREGYKVHPPHNKNEFLPITYIEPSSLNKAAIGLDMAHEVNRYTAAIRARETGAAQITGPITLVQDAEKTPGFLFYAPFYIGGKVKTLEDRRKNFAGLVYAPFVVKKLMEGTLENKNRHVSIRIIDDGKILYDELVKGYEDFDPNSLYRKKIEVAGYGRTFDFNIHSSKSFREATENNQPMMILAGGVVIEILMLTLFLLLARANRNAVALADRVTSQFKIQVDELKEARNTAQEANRLKSSFLATMSHEIRTPLNGIMGMGQLLQREAKGDFQKKMTASIINSGELLLSIIESILDISKIESGLIKPDKSALNLGELCKEVASGFYAQATEKQIDLIVDVQLKHTHYFGDKNILKQVLINLIGNALKFTEKGSVRLEVTALEGDQIQFLVVDTGIGIEEKYQKTIFERFRQVDYQNTRKYGGTGLGLSITKDFVNLLDGDISVSSKLGEGAEFKITMPLPSTEIPETPRSDEEQMPVVRASKKLSTENLRVLVAEDNEVNQDLILEFLVPDDGYDVEIAQDGVEALAKLEAGEYDIILMDIQMPRMTGDEAIRKIRASDKSYKDIPIIVLTANAMRGAAELYLLDGADAYLTKPINLEGLISAISDLLDRKKDEIVA
ncbi:MAG: CHASE domain-containing protein [Methyloligellaceae bacterium]